MVCPLETHTCTWIITHVKSFLNIISHTVKLDLVDYYLLWLTEQQMSHVQSSEIVCAGFKMTTLQLQKESLQKKTYCKSCIYNYADLVSYNSNSPHSSHNNDLLPVGLLAQFVWVLHRYRRGQGFESCTSPNSFCLSFCNCKRCVYNCRVWFYFHIILHPTVQIYDFHIFMTVL